MLTIAWLMRMIECCLYTLVRGSTPKELARHVDTVTAIVWASLYAGAPTRG